MRSLSARVLELVACDMPQTEVAGGFVVLRPTSHIVRGFTLERTSRKGEFYLWSIVIPLFAPVMRNVSLNYSSRFSLGGLASSLDLSKETREKARITADYLIANHYQRWGRLGTPSEFLKEFEPIGDFKRPNIKLEFAMARCLCGDLAGGRQLAHEVAEQSLNSPLLHEFRQAAIRVVDAIDSTQFDHMVESLELENTQRHFPGLTKQ